MSESLEVLNTLEYRTFIVDSASRTILVLPENGGLTLPRVSIPPQTRAAEQLCKAIFEAWGLHVVILDFLPDGGSSHGVVAELLTSLESITEFESLPLDRFPASLLSELELVILTDTINDKVSLPFSRLGWIDQAVAWLEKETDQKLSSRECIQQLNAGGVFALLRLPMGNGRAYWLKAAGEPNTHECAITAYLSHHFPDALPALIAVKENWNAWLTEEVGTALPDLPTAVLLTRAARQFSSLQLKTVAHTDALLAFGAFDLRISKLVKSIDPIMQYLADAMAGQQTTKVAPLSPEELRELTTVLWDSCECMQSLGVPDTLIHNDLSPGNALDDGSHCVFTDWSEAAISNPFLSCERLCQWNASHRNDVQAAYRQTWSQVLYATAIDRAFALMPLIAIYAYLFGRGDWMRSKVRNPRFESYARSLARLMYREAKNPNLLEALCH